MSFSYDTYREIWERDGGRERASCKTCGVKYQDGYNLDCSHLDHQRDKDYDNPNRGILECLRCHLKRHIKLYFKACCENKKKNIKQERFSCLTICYRIITGEGKWTNSEDVTQIKVKNIKKSIKNVIFETTYHIRLELQLAGFNQSQLKLGMQGISELIVFLD